jgi:hypothetical protein
MGLQLVEIVLAIEKHFGVSIPDDDAGQAVTVGSMQMLICELLAERRKVPVDDLKQEVWDGLIAVVSDQMGIKPCEIRPESKWVGDITRHG